MRLVLNIFLFLKFNIYIVIILANITALLDFSDQMSYFSSDNLFHHQMEKLWKSYFC